MAPNPPPLGRWKISFQEFLGSGMGMPTPGFLLLWPKNWLVLVNHKDSPLVGKHQHDGEKIFVGSTVRFPSHEVVVLSCLRSPPGFSTFPEAPPVRWSVSYFPIDHSRHLSDSKPPLGRLAFLILKPHAKRLFYWILKSKCLMQGFFLLMKGSNLDSSWISKFSQS
jgi:hypothetical protein